MQHVPPGGVLPPSERCMKLTFSALSGADVRACNEHARAAVASKGVSR